MKPDKIAMKKLLLPALALIASLSAAQAQYFTNGNLAVVRIGGVNQSVTTTGGGNPVWIDQYTTNGTLANSFPIPSSGVNALILNGVSYGGYLSSTPDGTHLVIGGFNTSAPYTSNGVVQNVAYSYSTNVPRAVATIDGYGNYALPIVNSNIYNTYTITGAASDGSNFWTLGTGATSPGTSGLVYAGTALAGATNPVARAFLGEAEVSISITTRCMPAATPATDYSSPRCMAPAVIWFPTMCQALCRAPPPFTPICFRMERRRKQAQIL